MKNWQETTQLIERVMAIKEPAVLATVIQIKGSTYRRPGAKLLMEADGTMVGNVSGGCLESDVRERALNLLKTGKTALIHYDTSAVDDQLWGMGLGCNGQVDLFVQPFKVDAASFLQAWKEQLAGDRPFAVTTVCAGASAGAMGLISEAGESIWIGAPEPLLEEAAHAMLGQAEANPTQVGEELQSFIEIMRPPPTLLICGAGDDAMPLAALAEHTGFRVVVADHRSAYLTETRFPGARARLHVRPEDESGTWPVGPDTWAVVKTHTLTQDAGWVKTLVDTTVPYIGLLGPRERREEILEQVEPSQRSRLYAPVGLDLGGEGAEQVALSIVAEIMAVRAGHTPGHLKDRLKAIHTH